MFRICIIFMLIPAKIFTRFWKVHRRNDYCFDLLQLILSSSEKKVVSLLIIDKKKVPSILADLDPAWQALCCLAPAERAGYK